MAFPISNVIISEVQGQCHFAASVEICEHGLWGRGRKYMLLVQVWHTRVCTTGRKLPWRTRMGGGEWAHLPMVSKNPLWLFPVRWAFQIIKYGKWMSSHPSHPARVEWEAGDAWEQLPGLESAGSGWGWLARSFGICHLLMWKLPFLPECTFLSHEGF